MDERIREMRKLFAAAKKRGLSADDLRGIAAAAKFGDSLAALSAAQLYDVRMRVEHRRRREGWTIETADGKTLPAYSPPFLPFRKPPAPDCYKMLAKISRMLAATGASWEYVDGIAAQMFRVKHVDDCSPAQMHSVVSAMMTARRRRG